MPTYHGIARSSTPASTRAACEDHPTRPVQLRKGHAHGELECGFEGQQWAGAGVPVPSFADPATAAAQLRPLFEPIGGNWRWSFLQPSAAPRIVLTGGGRECGENRGAGLLARTDRDRGPRDQALGHGQDRRGPRTRDETINWKQGAQSGTVCGPATCSPPNVHTSTHHHHLLGIK